MPDTTVETTVFPDSSYRGLLLCNRIRAHRHSNILEGVSQHHQSRRGQFLINEAADPISIFIVLAVTSGRVKNVLSPNFHLKFNHFC